MPNKDCFESMDVVNEYSAQNYLLKPEKTILRILKTKLNSMRMLDIGIGGGRTTSHFAKLCREYVGIDYSKNMIWACRKRFPENDKRIIFRVCDAKRLKNLRNGYFDFILFSYNGIDYLSHLDRLRAFKEIRRVGKKGGKFFFSTHNLNSSKFDLSSNPKKLFSELIRNLSLFFSKSKQHVIIRDGSQMFRLRTYYISPAEQVSQLEKAGFKRIRAYSLDTGGEIKKLSESHDIWIHYLCEM